MAVMLAPTRPKRTSMMQVLVYLGRYGWSTNRRIRRFIGRTERTTQRYLRELESAGLVAAVRRDDVTAWIWKITDEGRQALSS